MQKLLLAAFFPLPTVIPFMTSHIFHFKSILGHVCNIEVRNQGCWLLFRKQMGSNMKVFERKHWGRMVTEDNLIPSSNETTSSSIKKMEKYRILWFLDNILFDVSSTLLSYFRQISVIKMSGSHQFMSLHFPWHYGCDDLKFNQSIDFRKSAIHEQ